MAYEAVEEAFRLAKPKSKLLREVVKKQQQEAADMDVIEEMAKAKDLAAVAKQFRFERNPMSDTTAANLNGQIEMGEAIAAALLKEAGGG